MICGDEAISNVSPDAELSGRWFVVAERVTVTDTCSINGVLNIDSRSLNRKQGRDHACALRQSGNGMLDLRFQSINMSGIYVQKCEVGNGNCAERGELKLSVPDQRQQTTQEHDRVQRDAIG